MHKTSALLAVLPFASAWPAVMDQISQAGVRGPLLNTAAARRDGDVPDREPLFLSNRPNTGIKPPAGFDAEEQLVDVSEGSGHEWQAPGPGDLRGQCPGLNAAANHGFLPRNGMTNIAQTVAGLGEAYNMAVDLSSFLAVVAIALSGDYVTTTWSIGGSFPATIPGLLGNPTGILGTHSSYENDASPVRGDAYLNDGNVGVFQMRSWERMYGRAEEYTMDNLAAAQSDYVTRWAINNNPYAFWGPFSGLVAPAAHNFIINFMSNRSAENPGGVLNRDVLKQFFSVTGDQESGFVHTPGHERIPDNWYKRPAANAYSIALVNLDTVVNSAMYPGIIRFGGNTGTTNSFVGVNPANITGGVLDSDSLLEGDNLSCFMLQAAQAIILDEISPLVSGITGFLSDNLGPLLDVLTCPELGTFKADLFNQFSQSPK